MKPLEVFKELFDLAMFARDASSIWYCLGGYSEKDLDDMIKRLRDVADKLEGLK